MSRFRRPTFVNPRSLFNDPDELTTNWTVMIEPSSQQSSSSKSSCNKQNDTQALWAHLNLSREVELERVKNAAAAHGDDDDDEDAGAWSRYSDKLLTVPGVARSVAIANQVFGGAADATGGPRMSSTGSNSNSNSNNNNNNTPFAQQSDQQQILTSLQAYPAYLVLVRALFPWLNHDIFDGGVSHVPTQLQIELGLPNGLPTHLTQFVATVMFVGFEAAVQQHQAEFITEHERTQHEQRQVQLQKQKRVATHLTARKLLERQSFVTDILPTLTVDELFAVFSVDDAPRDDDKTRHRKEKQLRILAETWSSLRARTVSARFPQGCPVVWVGLRRIEGMTRAVIDPQCTESAARRRRVIRMCQGIARALDRFVADPVNSIPATAAPSLQLAAKLASKHVTPRLQQQLLHLSSNSASPVELAELACVILWDGIVTSAAGGALHSSVSAAKTYLPSESLQHQVVKFLLARYPARLSLVVRERGVSAIYVQRPRVDMVQPSLFLLHNDGSCSEAFSVAECFPQSLKQQQEYARVQQEEDVYSSSVDSSAHLSPAEMLFSILDAARNNSATETAGDDSVELSRILLDVCQRHPLFPLLAGCGVARVTLSADCTASSVTAVVRRVCGKQATFDPLASFQTDSVMGKPTLLPSAVVAEDDGGEEEGAAAAVDSTSKILPHQQQRFFVQSSRALEMPNNAKAPTFEVFQMILQRAKRQPRFAKAVEGDDGADGTAKQQSMNDDDDQDEVAANQRNLKHIIRCHPRFFSSDVAGCGVRRVVVSFDKSDVAQTVVERVCGSHASVDLSECFDSATKQLLCPMVPVGSLAQALAVRQDPTGFVSREASKRRARSM